MKQNRVENRDVLGVGVSRVLPGSSGANLSKEVPMSGGNDHIIERSLWLVVGENENNETNKT